MNATGPCPDCHTLLRSRYTKRGLCNPCYDRRYRQGTHIDAPAVYRSRTDVLDDYRLLRGEGYTQKQVAERMGMRLYTLRRALWRARRDGVAA